jgi:hypothetical protein
VFFRAYKHKKIADAVLSQVTPLLTDVTRFGGDIVPARLAADKYLLGFFCGNVIIEMQRAGSASLDQAGRGTVLFLVLQQLFGRGTIDQREIGDLLNGVPTPNGDFRRGADAAGKIQAAASGRHKLQSDADYLAAKDVIRRTGGAGDFLTSGASEDSKIAGEMLRALYYQHVIDQHQGASKRTPQTQARKLAENREPTEDKVKLAHEIAQMLIGTQIGMGGRIC